jgi:hypothetical protein
LGQLLTGYERIAEIEVNPIFATDKGLVAVDARVRIV